MDFCNMLDDSQPKAGATRLFGTAFVHAEETLKDAFLVFQGNADAVILDDQPIRDRHPDMPALLVIADGIVAQIVNQLLHQFFVGTYCQRRPFQGKRNTMFIRYGSHHICTAAGNLIDVYKFKGLLIIHSVIKLR